MPRTCVVAGCSNIKSDERGISIHSFPKSEKRHRLWEKQVQKTRAKWSVSNPRTTYICSAHFSPDCFEETPQRMTDMGMEVQKKRVLKPTAVPTIFPKIVTVTPSTTLSTGPTAGPTAKTPQPQAVALPMEETTPKRPRLAFEKREKGRVSIIYSRLSFTSLSKNISINYHDGTPIIYWV